MLVLMCGREHAPAGLVRFLDLDPRNVASLDCAAGP